MQLVHHKDYLQELAFDSGFPICRHFADSWRLPLFIDSQPSVLAARQVYYHHSRTLENPTTLAVLTLPIHKE